MGVLGNIAFSDELTIFVMDSLPRFIDYVAEEDIEYTDPAVFKVKRALYEENVSESEYTTRPYSWSRFQAGTTVPKPGPTTANTRPKFLVNLTDKLRFKMDINTDDELEDLAASLEGDILPQYVWDFRYGRTNYSFANVAISGDDTVIIDTLFDYRNPDNNGNNLYGSIISQLRPS
jgi:hypothetical protein